MKVDLIDAQMPARPARDGLGHLADWRSAMSFPARSEQRQAPRARPKIIYVMGAGRSGSTILGVTLGNCDGVFYAGELDKWLARSGHTPLPGAGRESFWEQVREGVAAADLYGGATRCLERSSALFQPRCWPVRRRLRSRYRRVAQELYLAVARAAGASHIVDTSHYPLRASQLQALDGIELYLLFAVREPHSVVASFGREDVLERRFGPLAANAYMFLTYLVSTWVFLRHPRERRLVLRHETFREDPAGAIRQVLDITGSRAALPDMQALGTGRPFQGNRLVRSETVSLQSGRPAPAPRLPLTSVIQLPWRLVFRLLRPAVDVSMSQPLG
jgi:hypothetical protein